MFLRNSWYVAGWSRSLAQTPLAIRMLDEAVVIYRLASGDVAALEDHCPHRHLPLSLGMTVGDNLQCGYHGMTFDRNGRCVSVPSQDAIPRGVQVKAYPALERYGWIWVWMGDAALADPALVPDFHWMTSDRFAAVGKTNHVACNYKLVTDNLMDLSHVGYVHTTTIGNPEFAQKGTIAVSQTDTGLRVTRLVPDVPPPPLYVKSGRLPAGRNIDRWSIIDFIAPCFVIIHTGGAEVGTGALEGRYEHGLNLWVLNAMTPETDKTTNYFWGSARSHALGDPVADTLFFSQVSEAFEEDRRVLEAQQRVLEHREDTWTYALKADAGSMLARRILGQRIDRERARAVRDKDVA